MYQNVIKVVVVIVVGVTLAACDVGDEPGPRSDEDLFGLRSDGKADGAGPDVDAIRSLDLGQFTANEILIAAEANRDLTDFFRRHPERKTELLRALMNRVDRDDLAVSALFFGRGWERGFLLSGGSSRWIDVSFVTPQGSVATQRFELNAIRVGPQLGLEYGLVVGAIVNAEPGLTLRDLEHDFLGGIGADAGGFGGWPVSVGAGYFAGDRFDLIVASVGFGYDVSAAFQGMYLEMCEDCPPQITVIAPSDG